VDLVLVLALVAALGLDGQEFTHDRRRRLVKVALHRGLLLGLPGLFGRDLLGRLRGLRGRLLGDGLFALLLDPDLVAPAADAAAGFERVRLRRSALAQGVRAIKQVSVPTLRRDAAARRRVEELAEGHGERCKSTK